MNIVLIFFGIRPEAIKMASLVNAFSYPDFVWLMNKSKIIITDSGGVQHEAPSLGKTVLVMRDITETPESRLNLK